MLPRIVGLNGKKGAGKDTAGARLAKQHGYTPISFAEPLKRSAAALFDIPLSDWEEYKNNPMVKVGIYQDIDSEYSANIVSITAREFLQRYGTEAHREVFGPSFWTDMAILRIQESPEEKFVITDARFVNECSALRDNGGIIVEVTRPSLDTVEDSHASEADLPRDLVDVTLVNSGTIEDLDRTVDMLAFTYVHPDADYRYVFDSNVQSPVVK